jgi:hypothetical protein
LQQQHRQQQRQLPQQQQRGPEHQGQHTHQGGSGRPLPEAAFGATLSSLEDQLQSVWGAAGVCVCMCVCVCVCVLGVWMHVCCMRKHDFVSFLYGMSWF